MRILKIQNKINNQQNLSNKHKALSFTATPEQILSGIEIATKKYQICSKEYDLLNIVAKTFKDYEKYMKHSKFSTIEYKLGQKNQTDNIFSKKKLNNLWAELDEIMNRKNDKGESIGKSTKEILQFINKENNGIIGNPDVITMNRPKKKKFSFFILFK